MLFSAIFGGIIKAPGEVVHVAGTNVRLLLSEAM
jgi:hypothetical protein